ncbi:hypothetical protein M2281_003309 [Mesorhizobium soli]|uniref:hypothetical protein n=1 Tax=Pseudaminobacter soli (ex Li et al. 2025) TaxID=1295366 RepID=UPI0024754EC0|nr:hypothetical protein [Mesorhizobium soli]MDH6232710.1 hypothetical protein [Mesorhizobium soli]
MVSEVLPEGFLDEFEPGGFFYEARKRRFIKERSAIVLFKLNNLEMAKISKEQKSTIIKDVWSFPFIASMYRERCIENGYNEKDYDVFIMNIYKSVKRIIDTYSEVA